MLNCQGFRIINLILFTGIIVLCSDLILMLKMKGSFFAWFEIDYINPCTKHSVHASKRLSGIIIVAEKT